MEHIFFVHYTVRGTIQTSSSVNLFTTLSFPTLFLLRNKDALAHSLRWRLLCPYSIISEPSAIKAFSHVVMMFTSTQTMCGQSHQVNSYCQHTDTIRTHIVMTVLVLCL